MTDLLDDQAGLTTRERIPLVALQLFAQKGYDATSMREIAENLGITKPALYYHFDSKEAIVRELLADLHAEVAALVDDVQGMPPTHETRRDVLLRWSDIMQSHGLALFRFMTANRNLISELKHGDADRQDMERMIERLLAVLLPTDSSVEDQVRVRMALMAINMGGMVGVGLEADDDQILAAARTVALHMLP